MKGHPKAPCGSLPRCNSALAPLTPLTMLHFCPPHNSQISPSPSLPQAETTRFPLPLSIPYVLQSWSPHGAGPSLQTYPYRKQNEDRGPGPAACTPAGARPPGPPAPLSAQTQRPEPGPAPSATAPPPPSLLWRRAEHAGTSKPRRQGFTHLAKSSGSSSFHRARATSCKRREGTGCRCKPKTVRRWLPCAAGRARPAGSRSAAPAAALPDGRSGLPAGPSGGCSFLP